MKVPLCEVCLKSNILCKACREKVKNENFSKQEIEIFRSLYKLSRKLKILREVEIKRILGNDRLLIITRKEDAPKLIGKRGTIVKKIGNALGKSIRIIEEDSDIKSFVQDMIYPIPVLGVNIVYGKRKKYVVRIPKEEEKNLFVSPETIVSACESIFNEETEVCLE
jgi:transcription antitermination factor NusA-like protein